MLSGDNGILQKATDAKTETEKGQEKEIVALAYDSALAKKVSNGDLTAVTSEDLNPELINQGASANGKNPITVTFTNSKRQYTINSNGTIDYVGIQSEEHSENDWIVAWTYNGINWSEPKQPGATLSGQIIAKVYETDTKTNVWSDTANQEVEINGYYLQLTGQGSMGKDLYDNDGSGAWGEYTLENGFNLYPAIVNVTVSNGITSICDYAFSYMILNNCNLPNSIQNIGDCAFEGSYISNFIIPSTLINIGEGAFHACSSLSGNITIMGDIGSSAFSNSGLNSVTIQSGVTEIADGAFSGCESLSTVTILDGATSVEHYAFANCTVLSTITIPQSITSIGNSAFWGSEQLANVYYEGTNAQFNEINIDFGNDNLTNANIHYSQNSQIDDE